MKNYKNLRSVIFGKILAIISFLSIFFSFEVNANDGKQNLQEFEIRAKKINDSANNISTKTGGSSYKFDNKAIEELPQGSFSSLNQLLLRSPGVTQDSFGQLRIRADHSNIQYRINDVMIPEGISGFGQLIDVNFIDNLELLTGALPAQYGYRTAGVIDIKTKNGEKGNYNKSSMMAGGNNHLALNQQFSGFVDNFSYHLNGGYLQTDRGIESPYKNGKEINNYSKQNRFFGNFSYLLNPQQKISLIMAGSNNNFNLPNNVNQTPEYQSANVNIVRSQDINQKQRERNSFVVAALNGISDFDLDYQLSFFNRLSETKYRADDVGDLVFNGIAADVDRKSIVNGLQIDAGYKINDLHHLRSGIFVSNEETEHFQNSLLFPADDDGNQTSDIAYRIANGSKKKMQNYGIYLQDEIIPVKNLKINLGLRFDQINAANNHQQLAPRLGINYDVNDKITIHSGYAKYLTPPRAELLASANIENFKNSTNKAVHNDVNNKIRAERTDYYDIGIAYKANKNLTLAVDSYYKNIDNLLDEGQFGQALIYTPFNYQKAKSYGIEFTIDYKKDNLRLYSNLATQKMKAINIISSQYLFEADELDYIKNRFVHVDHDQSYNASAGASYKYNKTLFSGDVIYGSGLRRGFANSNRIKSYYQVNIAINQQFKLPIIREFESRLSLINLLNNRYQLRDGSGIGVGAPQYQMGRTLYLGLAKQF